MSDRLEIERLIKDFSLFNKGPEEQEDVSPPPVCVIAAGILLIHFICSVQSLAMLHLNWSIQEELTFVKPLKGKFLQIISQMISLMHATHAKDSRCNAVINHNLSRLYSTAAAFLHLWSCLLTIQAERA